MTIFVFISGPADYGDRPYSAIDAQEVFLETEAYFRI